jgi:ABC-type multidrug transport system fused ATPase/permease subunit
MTPERVARGSEPSSALSVLSGIRFLLGERRGRVAVLGFASLASGLTESAMLAIVAQAATSIVSGTSRVHVNLGQVHVNATIAQLLVIALFLAIARLLLQILVTLIPARISTDLQIKLRSQLFSAYTRASWAVQSRDQEGHLQEVVTNQVGQATGGAAQAAILVTALLTFLVLVVSAIALNVFAAVIVLAAAASLFLLLRPLSSMGRGSATGLSLAYMDYANAVGEAVRTSQETHVFGVGAPQREGVDFFIEKAGRFYHRTQVLASLPAAVYQSLVYLIVVAGLILLTAIHPAHIAALGAVVLVLVRAGSYGQQAQSAYQGLRQTIPYLDRLEDSRRGYLDSTPRFGDRAMLGVRTIAFHDVSFAYRPNRAVLERISFEVDHGEAIGIIGPSGAGKSTLVQILLRLRSPGSGSYLINGEDAHDFADEDWHRRFAFVPQEPRLLHASVADNIRYFRDLSDEAVKEAARLAGIHDDVVTWSDGYDTIVGPRADAVSGGQQQRICLARALAGRPQVLVLDEPTSALDPHSETLIHASLSAIRHDLTLFIIAHRMSTVEMCDRLMVIVKGHVEAFDTTESMLATSSYYRSVMASVLPRTIAQA